MTDLDFDELDKAVNNLMSNVDTTNRMPGLDDPEDKVVDISTSTTASATNAQPPVLATPAPAAQTSTVALPAVSNTPPLAVKRRGQFMDFKPSESAKVTPPISRQGKELEPSNLLSEESTQVGTQQTNAEPVSKAAPLNTEPEVTQHLEANAESDTTTHPAASTDSEPLATPADESNDTHQFDPLTSSELPEEVVAEVADPARTEEPLASPFLPDAKVEKRPLGTPFASTDSVTELSEATEVEAHPAEVTPSDAQSDVPHTEEALTTPLPAELHTDIVALESSSTNQESHESPAVKVEPTVEAGTVTPEPAQVPAGGSIAQQYTEQPSTGDQTTGAMYDTATYHKAVDVIAKKKSSKMMWVVWMLVLLALGAAGGAGYFYWTTQ